MFRAAVWYAISPLMALFALFTLIVIIPLTKLFDGIRSGEYFE